MPLDQQSLRALDLLRKSGAPDVTQVPPDVARKSFHESYFALFPPRNKYLDLARTENRRILGPFGEFPIRIYKPIEEFNLPICLYIHGGGWIRGDLDIYDYTCRALSVLSRHIVVSVDYHLSPEAKFPTAAEECYFSLKWLKENSEKIGGTAQRLSVAGDSSGGNLAASAALMCRDRNGPQLNFQLLIYPVLNYDFSTASYIENGEGYFLTKGKMEYFWKQYLRDPNIDQVHPYASPLRAEDFHGLPATHIITAEYDPLRDEGKLYSEKLAEAGVPVTYEEFPGTIHAFMLFSSVIDKGELAFADAAARLKSS